MIGKPTDATMRLQRDAGEHPAEPIRTVRDGRRLGRRAHPARHKGECSSFLPFFLSFFPSSPQEKQIQNETLRHI